MRVWLCMFVRGKLGTCVFDSGKIEYMCVWKWEDLVHVCLGVGKLGTCVFGSGKIEYMCVWKWEDSVHVCLGVGKLSACVFGSGKIEYMCDRTGIIESVYVEEWDD